MILLLADGGVLLLNFNNSFFDLFLQLFYLFLLLLKLLFFVLNLAFFVSDFAIRVGQLVFCELKFSFASQFHVVYLFKALFILALDVLDLLFRIVIDLIHGLCIVSFHGLDFFLKLLYLLSLSLDKVGVLFKFLIDGSFVLCQ